MSFRSSPTGLYSKRICIVGTRVNPSRVHPTQLGSWNRKRNNFLAVLYIGVYIPIIPTPNLGLGAAISIR